MPNEHPKQQPDHTQGADANIGPQRTDEKAAVDPIADKYASGEGKMTDNPGRRQ